MVKRDTGVCAWPTNQPETKGPDGCPLAQRGADADAGEEGRCAGSQAPWLLLRAGPPRPSRFLLPLANGGKQRLQMTTDSHLRKQPSPWIATRSACWAGFLQCLVVGFTGCVLAWLTQSRFSFCARWLKAGDGGAWPPLSVDWIWAPALPRSTLGTPVACPSQTCRSALQPPGPAFSSLPQGLCTCFLWPCWSVLFSLQLWVILSALHISASTSLP